MLETRPRRPARAGEPDADAAANAALDVNWRTAKDWSETSRYEQKTQAEAQAMYDAVANDPDGVLAWIRIRW
jgi:hypothetical protein